MALINCPECGRQVTNTAKNCIHCGFPLKEKKKVLPKVILVILLIVVIPAAIFAVKKITSKKVNQHTIQHTQLFELMEYKQPKSIKDVLGDDYEYKSFNGGSSCEDYEDIEVDGLKCSLVEISYDYGEYERILFEASEVDEKTKDILVKDFIAQYGKEYDYEEKEKNGSMAYNYTWDLSKKRRIFLNVYESKEKGTYWVGINSFHKWIN